MKIPDRFPVALIVLCFWVASAVGAPKAKWIDFSRQILPILSNKCFVCHGPDAKRKNILRLDSRAGATKDLGGYRAIDPKALEKSEIIARIHDTKKPMPPRRSEKQLTEQERALLTQWVKEGGSYARHWAFIPPTKQRPPVSSQPATNEIDLFLLAKLKEMQVDMAPAADRATLARRAALILTGLPPEPELLKNYLSSPRADAYERYVDQLLASPRYGEHQARYWLDAVRYGDTHGLHLDNRRGIYPYRDWVVRAMNQNLSLSTFITWQLAGDLLPNPTLEQQVATGFIRMNPTTAEGGAIPAEFQAKNNFDRTETLGTVLLGMTLTCARCHTHKYDPISHREYYRLLAFFNSTAEHSMDGNAYVYGPAVKAPQSASHWGQWERIEKAANQILKEVKFKEVMQSKQVADYRKAIGKWSATNWMQSKIIPADKPAPEVKEWTKATGLPGARRRIRPGAGQSVWLSFDLEVPHTQMIWLSHSGSAGSVVEVDGESISSAAQSRFVPLHLEKGKHEIRLQVLGSAQKAPLEIVLQNPWLKPPGNQPSMVTSLLLIADPTGPFASVANRQAAVKLAAEVVKAQQQFTTTLVARDLPTPRPTKVLERGEYNRPIGEALSPGALTVMGGLPVGAPKNRLGLAQWLTSRKHPLVSRVLINRVWQRTFGQGLVRTPEDFGAQGEQPTHPELLDWLAVELQDSGWDLKHMLRLMVTSRAFRQQSIWRRDVVDPENKLFARGPRFRLDAEVIRDVALWSSGLLEPTMGSEGIKPYQPAGLWLALAHPGSNTKRYVPDQGSKLYRRSLYVYWKRTSPHPMMTLFDAPSREASCVKRSRTNTPLQSLGLLNENQRVEMGRVLAERLLKEADNNQKRMDLLFTLVASRKPAPLERAACERLWKTMKQRYATAQDDAIALISSGPAPRDTNLNPSDHAAWTQVAMTVLAGDLALMVY